VRVTFLGTGTSHGVPMIGCDCPVCSSNDPKNQRTRASVLVEVDGVNLLIDTTPDLRTQVLRENVCRVDAILFTHAHADHIFGLDDVRRFNDISGKPMPCYGSPDTIRVIRQAFEYVFKPTQIGGGKPSLELIEVNGPFTVSPCPQAPSFPQILNTQYSISNEVVPVPIFHGDLPILGFRIGAFAYLTDCSAIPETSFDLLDGLDTLVLGVLRHEPHETHFSVGEGLAVVERLHPRQTCFTHLTHRLDHESTNRSLGPHAQLAYDGLTLRV